MIPRFPKRRMVPPRRWDLEPEDHRIIRDTYRHHTYGAPRNPSITRSLLAQEQFNVVPSEWPRF